MRPWQRLRADLVERKAWILVVVLVGAVVAVPVLMRHQPAEPPAPADPVGLSADAPAPDAALEAVGDVLVSDDRSAVKGAARDPFAPPARPKRTAEKDEPGPEPAAKPEPSSGSSSSSSSSSSPSPSPSPSPTPSLTPATPRATPTAAPTPAPRAPEPTTYRLLHVDLRFDGVPFNDAVRLRLLPGARAPLALLLGPVAGGDAAAFVVSGGAEVEGDGRCRPGRRLCTHLILEPGERATLTGADGEEHRLQLTRIRVERTTDRAKAEAFFARQSARGRCVLDVLDFLDYDAESGTLKPHHDARGCEYRIGGDGTVGTR